MPEVLRPVVVHVDHPGTVEDVAGGPERLGDPRRIAKVEQRPKGEKHAAALVGDGRATDAAAELARDDVLRSAELAVEEVQLIETVREADVGLVEDHGPLERSAVERLLVSDSLIRKGEAEEYLEECRNQGGECLIISSVHEGGKKLDGLGGIGAFLRYKL